MRNRYLRDRMIDRNYNDRGYRDMRNYDRTYYDNGYDDRIRRNDFRMNDYTSMENDYYNEIGDWCNSLKSKVRFPLRENDIAGKARQMGIKFDEYNEKDLLTTFYMLQSDFPNVYSNAEGYIAMAKEWLEDKDSALTGNEKLTAYYYTIVKGE